MLPVAVLDDGICLRAVEDLLFRYTAVSGSIRPANGDGRYRGHGTTVARILRLYAPDMPLADIRVIGAPGGRGTVQNLIAGLDFCARSGVRIANVSLGTTLELEADALRRAAESACERGVLIVAADSNEGGHAYPACLDSVLGVRTDESMQGLICARSSGDGSGIDVCASSRHSLLIDSVRSVTPVCNSFAAPAVTVLLWKLLCREPQLSPAQAKGRFLASLLPQEEKHKNILEIY